MHPVPGRGAGKPTATVLSLFVVNSRGSDVVFWGRMSVPDSLRL